MPDHVMRHPWSTSGHPLKAHQAAPNHVRWGIWVAAVSGPIPKPSTRAGAVIRVSRWISASSRLLKKGVQVGNRRSRSLKPWFYWRKSCRSHGTFSPFGFADRPSWGTGY